MTVHILQSRLKHLEAMVEDGLSFLDKIKVNVIAEERNQTRQYFLDKGYQVETAAEILDVPHMKFNYYLEIRRNPNA